MRALPLVRSKIINLQEFIPPAIAMLSIVPATEIPLRRNPVRTGAVREDIAVVLLDAEAGLQQGSRLERRLFIQRQKPSALMKIGRRLDRVESIEIEVIKLLRKQRETNRGAMFRVDYIVEPGKRIEALALDVAGQIQILQTRHVVSDKAVFEALEEKQLVFLNRAANRHAWRRGGNAVDVTVTNTRPRQCSGDQISQLVAAGPGFNCG